MKFVFFLLPHFFTSQSKCVQCAFTTSLPIYLWWSFLCVTSDKFMGTIYYWNIVRWSFVRLFAAAKSASDLKLFSFQSVSITTWEASFNAFTLKYLCECAILWYNRECFAAIVLATDKHDSGNGNGSNVQQSRT